MIEPVFGVPISDYHTDREYLSSTAIRRLAHADEFEFYKFHVERPGPADTPDNTDAIRFGRAVHALLDGTFSEQFTIVSRLSKGKPEDEINQTMATKAVLHYESLREHPEVAKLLNNPETVYELPFEKGDVSLCLRTLVC